MKEIKITKRDREKAEAFATLRCGSDTSLYEKRGAFKKEDILNGALAELAAYKLLKSEGFSVKRPDFTVYDKKQKSYAADLCDGTHHFHVKGQGLSSALRYGRSWIMQRHDPLFKELPSKNYIVPCLVDKEKGVVEVYGIIPIKTLYMKGCFGELKVPFMRRTKVALYKDYMDSLLTPKVLWGILYRRRMNGPV